MADFVYESKHFWLFLAILLTLSGCASLSKDECVTADWYGIGYEDGLQGKPAERIAKHRKACAKHGVTSDISQYTDGRDAGLEHFCEPRNGYRLGRAGTGYGGVCPVRSESEFLPAYRAGREIYDLQQSVKHLEQGVDNKRATLAELDEVIVAKEAELIYVGITVQRRVELLTDLRELQHEAVVVQDELRDMRDALLRRQAELDHRLEHAPQW